MLSIESKSYEESAHIPLIHHQPHRYQPRNMRKEAAGTKKPGDIARNGDAWLAKMTQIAISDWQGKKRNSRTVKGRC